MSVVPSLILNDGNILPQLSFGVFKIPEAESTAAVTAALEAGYRGIDTAAIYGNEVGTGAGIAAAGLPRNSIHVTSKLWHTDLGYDTALRAVEKSLANLKLDYLDLYLIHWPAPARDLYPETWRAMEKIQQDGLARSIGVSNFQQPHLARLINDMAIVPAVNQIELHPQLPQEPLRYFDAQHGIVTQAWSPLGHGQLLTDPTVAAIAKRHNKTPAQILLNWNLSLGDAVIVKSVNPQRITENLDVFDFQLTPEDNIELAALNTGERTGPDPNTFGS